MATTITNQARLQFTYGGTTATAASNIASTVMQGPLAVTKSVLESAYQNDSELTYIVNLTNSGAATLTNIFVIDDLGTYALSPTLSVTPLTYIGPAQLYINGVFSSAPTPSPGVNNIAFIVPSLAAGSTAMLIYNVQVNGKAPLDVGSELTNTVTVSAAGLNESVKDNATVPVDAYADVTILKSMSPNPVTDGSTLTNTFTIHNYGNTEATDVVLTDTFNPAMQNIAVTVNGTALAPEDYDYDAGAFTLPGAASSYTLSIPAADFTQDTATGEVTINPGTVTIVVTGTL